MRSSGHEVPFGGEGTKEDRTGIAHARHELIIVGTVVGIDNQMLGRILIGKRQSYHQREREREEGERNKVCERERREKETK